MLFLGGGLSLNSGFSPAKQLLYHCSSEDAFTCPQVTEDSKRLLCRLLTIIIKMPWTSRTSERVLEISRKIYNRL
jgi:hypothetical protein